MNALTRALADVCRERLLDEKWVIAPSLRVGHQWLDAVARGGQPVANARAKTLLHLALELASPVLARDGRRLLGTLEGEVLVGRAWARLASGRTGGYLFAIEPSLGLLQALFASIRDLRLAGLESARLRADAFEVGAKGQELGELLVAFVGELRSAGRVDHADVLRMAVARLRTDPHALGTDAMVLLPADAELTRLERDLASALPAGMLHRLPVDEPLTSLPESTDLALLRWLPKPPDAPAPASDGTARIARAIGEPNEVRQVFRRILAEGLALDDVELLHTDADTYVPLVYELAAGLRHDAAGGALPVTFVEGIPVRYTRPGRALMAWLAWQREGYPQSILVRMLQDGLLHLPEGEGAEPSGPQLANLLRPIPIGRGRERTLGAIDAQLAALERRARLQEQRTNQDGEAFGQPAAELRRRRAATQALRALVAELLAATPDAGASQAETLEAARTFLQRLVRRAGEDDEYARLRLVEEIEKLEAWVRDGEEVACLDAAEWLAGLPTGVRIKGSGPRPGCLHVASVGTGGHSGRRHTFIVGLDDSRFPGQGGQDPVLLDGERQQLCDELPTAAGRLEEKVARFARLLARLRGSATLSYSCRSLDDDREMFASPVVLAAYRILSGERDGDHAALDRWLEPPASFAPELPEACLDDAEWWLWRFCGPEAVGNTVEVLRTHFPRLVHGLEAKQERHAAPVTPYDGLVPEAGAENDPTAPDGPVVSASRLQTLGACPLRYFFRYILGIEPPEELEVDPTRWLDPLAFGSLLHEVFCQFMRQFMRQLGADGLRPAFNRDRARLLAILDAHIARYRAERPPPSDLAFAVQRRDLVRTAETFLREEGVFCASSEPLYFEASIGMRSDGAGTPLDTCEPATITLPDGRPLRVRGRLDRIDRVGDPSRQTFTVWDYKTGSTYGYDHADPFRHGRLVQNTLSLRLAEMRLKATVSADARVERFGYFFPGVRAHGERIEWTAGELKKGLEVVGRMCDVAASGCFLATNTPDDCTYCDYKPICGDIEALTAASQAKLDDASNTLLASFRELRAK